MGGRGIAASFDYNVRFECEITARNKRKCTAKCLNGGKIIGKNKFVMGCKCPRYNGERQCGWYAKQGNVGLSKEFIHGLTCVTDDLIGIAATEIPFEMPTDGLMPMTTICQLLIRM